MNIPLIPGLSDASQAVLGEAVRALAEIPSVAAVVLGGSWARGVAGAASDLDVGISYREEAPLDVGRVREVAQALAKPGAAPLVTDLYGWGPWVNGGAWIQTPVTKVDFVYRNASQVRTVIEEGKRGVWRHDYDQQPPYGFRSVIYFAEVRYAIALWDPAGLVGELKAEVDPYPAALRATIVREGLWGAEFSLWSCAGFADDYNLAGAMSRAANYMTHALFALNGEYFLNDKHVARCVAGFAVCPKDYVARLNAVFSAPRGSVELLRGLWAETVALTRGEYRPMFDMSPAR